MFIITPTTKPAIAALHAPLDFEGFSDFHTKYSINPTIGNKKQTIPKPIPKPSLLDD